MIVMYLRSSSISCHDMCAMKYYIEYILGWRSPSNKKAEKGTIVHKVMEVLAGVKLTLQNGKRKTYDDDVVGRVHTEKYNLDTIIEKAYQYYSGHSIHKWEESDFKECRNWVYKALEYHGGEFNPLNCDVVAPEQSFDITITEPWAMYDYTLPDGKRVEGFLRIKGTIDQISKIDDETYLILDWKTGRRWDWAKDKEKTIEHLHNDHQLMMYFYAAQHIYPDIDHFMVTIYFINDGGPYQVSFSKEDMPWIERMLQKKFEDIKNTQLPAKRPSWKCRKFCHYGMNTFEGTSVLPIIEKRPNQVCNIGEKMTMCEQVAYVNENRSQDSVMKHMSAPGHEIDFYKAPGMVDVNVGQEKDQTKE